MFKSIFRLAIIIMPYMYSLQACNHLAKPTIQEHIVPQLSKLSLLEKHATQLCTFGHDHHLQLHAVEYALNTIGDSFTQPTVEVSNIPLTVEVLRPILPFCNLFGGLLQTKPLSTDGIKSHTLDTVTCALLHNIYHSYADSEKKQFDTLNTHALRAQMASGLMAQYMVLHALPKQYLFTNKGLNYLNTHTNILFLMTRMLGHALSSAVIPAGKRGTSSTELLELYQHHFNIPATQDIIPLTSDVSEGISQLNNTIITAYHDLRLAQQKAMRSYHDHALLMSLRLVPTHPKTHNRVSKAASNNTKLNALKKKKYSYPPHLRPAYKEMMLLENEE
ncbi:MAG: hypothetical protein WCE21_01580 [Candidatus Babeliales bacterium]